jgi:Domain of unknown function (DUF6968)
MIIATRVLKLRRTDGDVDVPIRIFVPELHETMSCWKVRYEIEWPDGKFEREGYGEDAVQALILTLQMIGAVLYTSEAHASGNLFWLEPGTGYGFLMPRTTRDLLIGDDKEFY